MRRHIARTSRLPSRFTAIAGALAFGFATAAAPSQAAAPAATSATGVVAQLGLVQSDRPVRELVKNWRKPNKVVVSVDDNPSRLAWMQEVAPGVTLIPVKSKEEALVQVAGADALIGRVRWCTPDLLQAGKTLKWIHTNAAGVNECDLATFRDRNIVLTNMQRVFGPEISDHVIALMLALTRGIDGIVAAQRQGKWTREFLPPERLWEVGGRTMLVVGLGGIGTDVARKAHGLGMRVIATRNSSREGPDFVEYVGLADELPKLIGQADVVVNATPLTPQTTGLFDAAMFGRMQRHAYFITVGRGKSVVTDDLIAALKQGTIGGAGLDVTDPEPLPDGHPLWSAPNVIISPHSSSRGVGTGTSGDRAWVVMREQLRRYVAGEKMYSLVDLNLGY